MSLRSYINNLKIKAGFKLFGLPLLGKSKPLFQNRDQLEKENNILKDFNVTDDRRFIEEIWKPFHASQGTPELLIRLGWVLSELHFGQSLNVLELDCSSGWLAYCLNRLHFNITGIDRSKKLIKELQKKFSSMPYLSAVNNYHFLSYDGSGIPLSDSSVHYIISFDSLNLDSDMTPIIKEMFRVLVPGGKLIITLSEDHSKYSGDKADDESRPYGKSVLKFIEDKALDAGFEEIYIKPFYSIIKKRWSKKEYHRLIKSYIKLDAVEPFRQTVHLKPIIICKKEGNLEESYRHRSEIRSDQYKIECRKGEEFEQEIVITNTGKLTLQSSFHPNGGYITINSKLFKGSDLIIECLGDRIMLGQDIKPGESIKLTLVKKAPIEPGEYIIETDLINEKTYWFSDIGCLPLKTDLIVK